MLMGLQVYFLLASIGLFLYAIQNAKNAAFSFGHGITLNIFPLAWMPYFSMDTARIGGIPLAYIPIIAVGFALIVRSKLRLKKQFKLLMVVSIVFIFYTFLNSIVLHPFSFNSFAYWFVWPLNILIFLSAVSFFSKLDIEISKKVIRSTVLILTFGSVVGVLRYLLGIDTNANFMPVVNRNGTVAMMVLFTPLIFYLLSNKIITKKTFVISLAVFAIALILISSRAGILGFIFVLVLYYIKFNLENIFKLFLVFLVVLGVVYSGIASNFTDRLNRAAITAQKVATGDKVGKEDDIKRFTLLLVAVEIIEKNLWLGTGLGVKNYRREFHEISNWKQDSKPHNFYLSYLAQLGVIGIVPFYMIYIIIYKSLAKMNGPNRAFRVSFWVIVLMMTMNEYIQLPGLWFFFGMLAGITYRYNELARMRMAHLSQPIK